MITGRVSSAREPIVSVTFRASDGLDLTVDALVDTGFSDFAALPADLVAALTLRFTHSDEVMLADDTVLTVDVYAGRMIWFSEEREVPVHCVAGKPLIGMSLLDRLTLIVDARAGGAVVIKGTDNNDESAIG